MFLISNTSLNSCPAHSTGLFIVKGLIVYFGSGKWQLQAIMISAPSSTLITSLSWKLYSFFWIFVGGGVKNIGIYMVCFGWIFPSRTVGRNKGSLVRENLKLASLLPGLVSFIVSLVVISKDCYSYINFTFVLLESITTGTDLAVIIISNSCWLLMMYFAEPRKSPKVSLKNTI